ncbi:MAG: asparaginase [Ahrensia sp.]
MANPIIAEVTRGGRVESVHRGAFIVLDGHGKTLMQAGDTGARTYPRSSMKLLQALVAVECGAAQKYTDAQLALLCASHSSMSKHVSGVDDMLAIHTLSERDLACGAHWPLYRTDDVVTRARQSGEAPNRAWNTCSGKHAGFLSACVACGHDTAGYCAPTHPIQKTVRGVVEAMCDTTIGEAETSFDGCSAPTFAMPLENLALGFNRAFTGRALEPSRHAAARQLTQACMKEPWFVAGDNRSCTTLMEAGQGRVFAKFGAEGVYVAGVPDLGIAMAMKCDDGATRAVEVLVAALLAHALTEQNEHPLAEALQALARQDVKTHAGELVGVVRASVDA